MQLSCMGGVFWQLVSKVFFHQWKLLLTLSKHCLYDWFFSTTIKSNLLLMSFLITYAMCNYIKLIIDAMRSLLWSYPILFDNLTGFPINPDFIIHFISSTFKQHLSIEHKNILGFKYKFMLNVKATQFYMVMVIF